MKRLAIALLCVLPTLAQPGRGPATPPPQLTPEQRAQFTQKIDEIDSFLRRFHQKNVNLDLIADVEVYSKAGKWLLEYPQGFVNVSNISTYLGVLDQGLERARLLDSGESPWVLEKGRKVLGYYSDLDGSVQPMGVTVPNGYDPDKSDRLYVWLHGRSNTLTEASFINGIKNAPQFPNTAYTADVGQLTLDCYGRGNNANHQAGEVDVFESIAAMKRRFKVDDNRVILRGFSLGGAAAWHLALQYPDRWAAAEVGAGTYPGRLMYAQNPFPPYQHGPLHIYENILDWALNATNFPLAAHDGENDTQVATVGAGRGAAPTPNRGQLESSLRVHAQLEKEGFPDTGLFLISSNTAHGVNRDTRDKLDAFLKEHGDKGRQVPDHIRFVTWTTRYNQCYWVTVNGLEKHYERAFVDADRKGAEYTVKTGNVRAFSLHDLPKSATLVIDGQSLTVKGPDVTLEKNRAWRPVSPGKTPGPQKTHALQGPIDDAFLDPFLLVKPTGQAWNETANRQALKMLERFDRLWSMNYRAHPRIKTDREVTATDFVKYNVVLFGDPGSNSWISKVVGKIPLKWTRETITVGGQSFGASDHVPVIAYPNPLNPKKYIVLNTGATISDQDYNGDYAMPRFGDVAVLKVKDPVEPPEIAWAALFDESWHLK